jgi:hypothetical protein
VSVAVTLNRIVVPAEETGQNPAKRMPFVVIHA